MKIKVCGMRDAGNIAEIAELHPDYMGFIFHVKSPRSAFGMEPEAIRSLPSGITPVAVSVNTDIKTLVETVTPYGIHTLQLHGDESPMTCAELREKGFNVWKCIRVNDDTDFSRFISYVGAVEMFLLDTATASGGGSGKKFDWRKLNDYTLPVPFMLAGGIAPDDAPEIGNISNPMFAGIDLNSRFEIQPGLKDAAKLGIFIKKLRPHPTV